jgi:hypothetical protein
MPQLIALALVGGVIFVAIRALRSQMKSVGEELERRERMRAEKDIRPLRQDPDGIYRPAGDEEK